MDTDTAKRSLARIATLLLFPLLLALLWSCGGEGRNGAAGKRAGEQTGENSGSKQELQQLSLGLMPAVDSAPILLAAERGYFRQEGLRVELEIYTNAQNRQSALQSGQIDGAITDLVALTTNVAGGFDIRATTLTSGMFIVLAREGSMEKGRITVGTMEISVTNYLLDHWMGERYNMDKVYINEIPLRLEAVASGKLDAGIFPEPLASVGAAKGLRKLRFPPPEGRWPDALVFTEAVRKEQPGAVRAFHRAYNRAVAAIRKDEAAAREILIARIPQLQPELRDALSLPEYRPASLPEREYLERVIRWTEEALDRDLPVAAEDLVDRSFYD
jgi:NitT/TauT family transport system substrate-binding protein